MQDAAIRQLEAHPRTSCAVNGQTESRASCRDPATDRALTIIHQHYADRLSVASLAREAGVSRTVLADRFNRLLGTSPMRYCTHWRLQVAADMLRASRKSSAEIAFESGFGSEAAFNRAFKRVYGQPPIAWRRSRSDAPNDDGLPEQQVNHCTAADGTRLAWAAVGSGMS